jgi:hypothetical protein
MTAPTVTVTPAQYTVTTTPGAVTVKTAPATVAVVSAAPQGPPGPPGASGTTDHAALSHLDYASAGHTGFTPAARQVLAGTGLSGGGDLSADRTLSLPALVVAGTYGDASNYPVVTLDAQGRVTAVSTRGLAPGGVTSFNTRAGAVTLTAADVTGALGFSDLARLGQANTFTAGPQTVVVNADGNRGVVVRANSATQSAPLQEWQTSSGGPRARVTAAQEFSNPSPNGCSGANNQAFGAGALAACTTGHDNTAAGALAAGALATGSGNVALGSGALGASVNGNSNMAVGNGALGANTSGSSNVAMGGSALAANTTGGSNTAVGGDALGSNTAAAGSTAVGRNALGGATGLGNTAVGNAALAGVTTGTHNCAVGYGPGSPVLATGSFNAFLGDTADAAAAATQFGLALGYGAICASNECAFGPNLNVQTGYGKSSTNAVRPRADFTDGAVDNTDATRKYRRVFNAWDTAAREVMRGEADGAGPRVGFLGAVAIARRTVNPACTDLATAVALTNQLRQLLIDLGYAQ